MKLANVRVDGEARVGLVLGDEFVDLTTNLGVKCMDVAQLLAMGAEGHRLLELAQRRAGPRRELHRSQLLAPVAPGDKILGVGMNYRSFVAGAGKLGLPIPTDLFWFMRPRSCLAGPYEDVLLPSGATDLDYEVELAVVIGKRCRNVSSTQAADCIAGYTVANDLTLRARAVKSPVLGKSFDTHTPMGPWLTTADEIGSIDNLAIRGWINGELRQDSSTSDMVVNGYELIAEISRVCTLNAGDVILTGTPFGSGIFQPEPRLLRRGDVMKMEIEGLGFIENRIVDEPEVP